MLSPLHHAFTVTATNKLPLLASDAVAERDREAAHRGSVTGRRPHARRRSRGAASTCSRRRDSGNGRSRVRRRTARGHYHRCRACARGCDSDAVGSRVREAAGPLAPRRRFQPDINITLGCDIFYPHMPRHHTVSIALCRASIRSYAVSLSYCRTLAHALTSSDRWSLSSHIAAHTLSHDANAVDATMQQHYHGSNIAATCRQRRHGTPPSHGMPLTKPPTPSSMRR